MMNKALITGVTGQDGSFLAEFLLEKGYDVRSNALLDSLRYIYKVAEIAKFKQRILLVRCLLFLLFCIPSYLSAQDNKSGTVDIFMGVDFNYRDIYFKNSMELITLIAHPRLDGHIMRLLAEQHYTWKLIARQYEALY